MHYSIPVHTIQLCLALIPPHGYLDLIILVEPLSFRFPVAAL